MRYLIGTGNRSWTDPNIWSLTSGGAPYQPASGTEKITNAADREFSSDTGFWIKGNGWSISDGYAKFNATVINSSLYRTILSTVGKWHKITLTVLNVGVGNLAIRVWDGSNTYLNITTSGTYVIYAYAITAQVNITALSTNTAVFDIDNYSVQEVDTIAPDATTSCIFDNNSDTGTITVNAIANMLDFTCTNIGALTIANAAYAFNVYGSLTLHTSLTVTFTSTGYLYMKATDSRTITTNGKVANWNRLYFDGVGGTWTLQDDFNINNSIYHANGTFTTNNKNLNLLSYSTETGTKIINFTNSTITLFQIYFAGVGLTFNCGTSTIRMYYNNIMYHTGNYTFYNYEIIGTTIINAKLELTSAFIISNNLTFTGSNAQNNRLLIASNTIGTPRTITCNGTVTASNVDFRDITLAGTCNKDLSAISGGSGDCGGNSGITFTTAQAQYFKKYASTANVGDAANWFSDLALTVAGRVPLPQDLGSKFISTSFNQTCTVSCNVPRIPCLDMSAVVNAVTWSLANAVEVYGSYVLGNNITPSGAQNIELRGRGVYNLNFYGKIQSSTIRQYAPNGTYILQSNLTQGTNSLEIINGTFNTNFYNLTNNGVYTFSSGTDIYLNTSVIRTTFPNSSTHINISSSCNISAENSTIIIEPLSGVSNIAFAGGGKSFNKIQFSGSHTGNFDISGSNTIAELIIDSGRKVRSDATQNVGKATIGTGATISNITAGQKFSLNYTGSDVVESDGGITVTNSIATPSEKWYAGDGSTDGGGNSGWLFETAFTPKIMWFD